MRYLLFTPLALTFLACTKQDPRSVASSPVSSAIDQPCPVLLSPATMDLGELPIGTTKAFSTRIVNSGSVPLEISEVVTSCGCVNVKCQRHVMPGSEAELTGILRVGNKPGPVKHQVRLSLKNPVLEPLSLEIRARSERTLRIRPERIVFTPDFVSGHSSISHIEIVNRWDKTINLDHLSNVPQGITVKCGKAKELAPGELVRMSFTADPVFVQAVDGELLMSTSHPTEGIISIPYSVRPPGALECTPKEIRLGVVSKGETHGNTFRCRIRGKILNKLTLNQVIVPSFLSVASIESERTYMVGPSNKSEPLLSV